MLFLRSAAIRSRWISKRVSSAKRGYVDAVLFIAPLTTPAFLIVWALDTTAAILVFLHANKHGSRHSTAWGISVFLALGLALPIYLVHGRRRDPRSRRY